MCYVNRQGGRSALLSRMAEDLWRWCNRRGVTMRAQHLPGKLNVRSDRISRVRVDRSESQLNPRYMPWLDHQWGQHTVDLCAGRHNRQCARYFSARHEPEAAATNAFLQDWSKESNPYIIPPSASFPAYSSKWRINRSR